MDVTATKTIRNKIYTVRFDIKITDADNILINKFGDPDVNYGGTINYTDEFDVVQSFTLNDNYRKLRGGTGWNQSFDGNMDAEAELKAIGFEIAIRARIAAAIATLRSNADNFTQVNTQTV